MVLPLSFHPTNRLGFEISSQLNGDTEAHILYQLWTTQGLSSTAKPQPYESSRSGRMRLKSGRVAKVKPRDSLFYYFGSLGPLEVP